MPKHYQKMNKNIQMKIKINNRMKNNLNRIMEIKCLKNFMIELQLFVQIS